MTNPHLAEDLALKRLISRPLEQKPNYNWRGVIAEDARVRPGIRVVCPHGDEDFDLSEVVDTIGRALTNVLLSRERQEDIFTDANKRWVQNIAAEIGEILDRRAAEEKPVRIPLNDLYTLIEAKLVEHRAYEVAKSILINRSNKLGTSHPETFVPVRLIRRNGHIVPWNEGKIEIAVRKAFLSLERDSAPAIAIAQAVTRRVLESKQAFMHIEEVQDLVQEELMRQGHFKVAEHYIIYRSQRADLRAQERLEPASAPEQNQLIVVKRPDGESFFWDGADLRERIAFARLGLDLCLSNDEIEAELRRAIFDEISQQDLNNTIVLNAKTLIEKDADFAKFAGRIQLTFIYEEVLDWDIVRDGIGSLKQFHQRHFRHYLDRGVSIKRLNPRLKDYDLERLADRARPLRRPRVRLPRRPDPVRPLPHRRQDR